MVELGAIGFYGVVVFVHVAAVLLAYGPTFAYPWLMVIANRSYRRSVPFLFSTQDKIGKLMIAPGSFLILLTGIYLVADGPYDFGALFVSVALPILLILIVLGPAFFSPSEARLAELAERDIAASGSGEVVWSAEYEALLARVATVGRLASLAVLVAVFFMVVKP